MHIDIDILVYALIAAVLLGRLWAVLGTRNDNDPQRPNPFTPPPPKPQDEDALPLEQTQIMTSSRLIPAGLPPASLAGGLAQVQAVNKAFNEKQFLIEARGSFTSIVETYATGDMTTISGLLSPALLEHFQKAADARKAAGQNAQSQVLRIKDAEVITARAEGMQAFVTVKFVSDQENIVRDEGGTIIGGVQGKAEEVTDVWVFACDASKPDSKWIVVETRG